MTIDPVSLAITAALTAAQMAVTASQTIEGPRLTDTKGTVADYGTPLNYLVGTRIISCPSFFAKTIEEVKKKRKGKGGKQVSYTGFATWASHIADHSIDDVLKIWFDNHLVYDNTGDSVKLYPLADDYELASSVRFYHGTPDQMPDPDMLAYIEARDGEGTCSAYRDTSYAYFDRIPIEQIGNRFPDVKMLVRAGGPSVCECPDLPAGWLEEFYLELPTPMPTIPLGMEFYNENVYLDLPYQLELIASPGDYANELITIAMSTTSNPDVQDGEDAGVECWFVHSYGSAGQSDYAPGGNDALPLYAYRYSASDNRLTVRSWAPLGRDEFDSDFYADLYIVGAEAGTGPDYTSAAWQSDESGEGHTLLSIAFSDGPYTYTDEGVDLVDYYMQFVLRQDLTLGIEGEGNPASSPCEGGSGGEITLGYILERLAVYAGADLEAYDFSLATQVVDGFNWTQGTGQQIVEALCEIYDVDLRPHDFVIQALPRGGASIGNILSSDFVAGEDGEAPYSLTEVAPGDLPRRLAVIFADTTSEQQPNAALPSGPEASAAGTSRESTLDMQTWATDPSTAQQMTERRLRRLRFGRYGAELSLRREYSLLEPGDVMTPIFDGEPMIMRAKKVTIGAGGIFPTEWEKDHPAIANLSGSAGASAAGHPPDVIPDGVDSIGAILDIPYAVDSHDQSAPLAYVVAAPEDPGIWLGADIAMSDTGELDSYTQEWDSIASSDGAVIGVCTAGLTDNVHNVLDMGSVLEVTVNAGDLTAATIEDLLLDPVRNLAAIEGTNGWELVQFMTPTLTAEHVYSITGFLRGVRGTEYAMGGHAPGDRFILLDSAKRHTMGASEIGDTDWYVVSTIGQGVDQADAFSVPFAGNSHRPLAAVNGVLTLDTGTDDWEIDATRRTRLGGASLNGGDVPLGETTEMWEADIMDGVTVKRTITGTSLPLIYTSADQTTDWGAPVLTLDAKLYQMNPPLSLRGFPLDIAA